MRLENACQPAVQRSKPAASPAKASAPAPKPAAGPAKASAPAPKPAASSFTGATNNQFLAQGPRPQAKPAAAPPQASGPALKAWEQAAKGAKHTPKLVKKAAPPKPAEAQAPATAQPAAKKADAKKPGTAEAKQKFEQWPAVQMGPEMNKKMTQIAEAYTKKTGKTLTVTSSTRTPEKQARAMFKKFELGADTSGEYKSKKAHDDIKAAYDKGKTEKKSDPEILKDMSAVIRDQVDKGIYISKHLKAGALDVRSKDMSAEEKKAFREAAKEVGGMSVELEPKPPHFHLQTK